MSDIPAGGGIKVPMLDGHWTVWSKSADSPGAYFVVPSNDKARALGVKYAVVRVKNVRNATEPVVELLRTDPYIEGLIP